MAIEWQPYDPDDDEDRSPEDREICRFERLGQEDWPELVDRFGRTIGAQVMVGVHRVRWSQERYGSERCPPYVTVRVQATRRRPGAAHAHTFGATPDKVEVGAPSDPDIEQKIAAEIDRRLRQTRARYLKLQERGRL